MTDQLSNGRLLHQQQDIKIYENKLFRWLCFDDEKAIQSCMFKDEPVRLNLAYQSFMMMWQLFVDKKPLTACLLGLGGGDIVRHFREEFPETKLLVVERDPIVAKMASEHFFIKPDQHYLTIEISDAEIFIQKQQKFDLIFIDIVTDNRLPKFLYSKYFWSHCYKKMSEQGVVALNVIAESETVFLNLLAMIKEIFGHFPLCMEVPEHKNVILLITASANNMLSFSELKLRGERLQGNSKLPFIKCLEILEKDNF